jgi:peptidylprolyl isomerase
MPKTASKRAEARRVARVQRAHQGAPERPIVRRVPAARRKAPPKGPFAWVSDYPWATTIFLALLIGLPVLILYQQHIGPFAPAKPKPPAQAKCDTTKHTCDKAPLMMLDAKKAYTATIKTDKGDIVIALDAQNAPLAVNNFVFLAQQRYYDGLYFWRVEKPGQPSPLNGQPSNLSLIQGGSVQADGKDDSSHPGYTFKDEPVVGDYTAGAVAMANAGANTNGAQFFINTGDNQGLPKSYTIFGHVTAGLDVAQKIAPDDKILAVAIDASTPPAATATPAK